MIPVKDNNLLAAFVGRGIGCASLPVSRRDNVAAGMFLTTYTDWRPRLFGNRLTTLVDLGLGVMEQALVEAAAYVIRHGAPDPSHAATFIRLLRDTDRPARWPGWRQDRDQGTARTRIFRVA